MFDSPTDFHRAFDEVPNDWWELTENFRHSVAGKSLLEKLHAEQANKHIIYPADPFAALRLTSAQSVRVVILGQDPYHNEGQAHGLAFSVPDGMKIPPSLRNIFKELQCDTGILAPSSGNLQNWAKRGILLLNTALTVRAHEAASHAHWGWEALTDGLIRHLAHDSTPKVFMLWGLHAQQKKVLIEAAPHSHLILMCNHPSPLSATRGEFPFIGSGHFGKAHAWLEQKDSDFTLTKEQFWML